MAKNGGAMLIKTKKLFKIIGVSFIVILIVWAWIVAPERMGEALIRGSGYAVIGAVLLILSGIFYLVKYLVSKRKRRKK